MIKLDEETMPGSTWNNTHDDEPVFIIRARDKSSVQMVRIWMQVASLLGVGSRKRHEAADLSSRMQEWQDLNPGLVEVPNE